MKYWRIYTSNNTVSHLDSSSFHNLCPSGSRWVKNKQTWSYSLYIKMRARNTTAKWWWFVWKFLIKLKSEMVILFRYSIYLNNKNGNLLQLLNQNISLLIYLHKEALVTTKSHGWSTAACSTWVSIISDSEIAAGTEQSC